ncbi:MAG: arylmalonate decarboxylase [Acidobacteriia bacterium]|nr:arylmalonate decarboxylase [Terriglobia bacterium]
MIVNSRRQFLKIGSAGAAAVAWGAGREPVLGMIFPPANYPVPPEAQLMYPAGVKFLAEGVGLERMTPAGYDKVVPKIIPAAVDLKKQGAQAISIMGTSLTFYKGAAFNEELKASVTKATGLRATTMSTAIVEGLKTVGARRVAVATAYNDVVNERLRVFLQESGFEVLTVKGLGIERFEDSPPVTREGLQAFSAGVRESVPKADSLLISCGALKTLEILAPLEQRCKVPVVSSLPHAFWASVRLLGLSGQVKGYGSLLARG